MDGVIDQDAPGLDRVELQAKPSTHNPVAPADIRHFFASLDAMKAAKDVSADLARARPMLSPESLM